jgi:CSLREA domain-containing protein
MELKMITAANIPRKNSAYILFSFFLISVSGCGGSSSTPYAQAIDSEQEISNGNLAENAFWVNSYVDAVDANPGDLQCATEQGMCTLRAAIMEANSSVVDAQNKPHTIFLPSGVYELTLPNPLATGDLGLGDVLARPIIDGPETGSLDIEVSMNIHGAGARETVIDAKQLDRVLEIHPGADSTLSDLTITGGFGNSMGGGIYSQAHISLSRVWITENWSSGGGGIFVNPLGSLQLNDSTVSHNIAKGQAGGIRIDTRGTITNSTISYNEALGLAEPLPMGTGVPFAFSQGGGIDIRGIGTTIRNSTIVFNRSALGGAGVHFDTAYVDALPDPITAAIDVPHFDLILENTIIANNSSDVADGDCLTTVGLSRILSQGNNIDSDGSCYLDQPGDISGIDPQLAELEDNGGATDTHALLPTSPALNAGKMSNCTAVDQRGVVRGDDNACDIGAFESGLQ